MSNTEGLTLGPKGKAVALVICWLVTVSVGVFYWYIVWILMVFYNQLDADVYLIHAQWFSFVLNAILAWWFPLGVTTAMMLLVVIANTQEYGKSGTVQFDRIFFYAFMFGIVVLSIWLRTKIPWRLKLKRPQNKVSGKTGE